MTARRFVLWFARFALIALSVTMGFVGCSRQSEGERCDRLAAGDTDCNEGLRCVICAELASGSVDRCCPPNAADASDSRCRRADPPRTNASECIRQTGGTGGLGSGGFAGRGTAGSTTAGLGGTAAGSGGSSNGEAGAPESGAGGT